MFLLRESAHNYHPSIAISSNKSSLDTVIPDDCLNMSRGNHNLLDRFE